MKYLHIIIEKVNNRIMERRRNKTAGEPVNYPIPGQPRIMRTVECEKVDFNTWANNIWEQTRKQY
jgi:hypothetical protein